MIYAVDFDGYLCKNAWPDIGDPNTDIIEHFKALKAEGHKLILWTCREGQALRDAINWCMKQGLHFDAYNSNLPEMNALFGNDSRKIGADFYCDDKNYWLMPERNTEDGIKCDRYFIDDGGQCSAPSCWDEDKRDYRIGVKCGGEKTKCCLSDRRT